MKDARRWPELWLWTAAVALLIALRVYPGFEPFTGNDTYQYFSMAEHALRGQVGYSSIIHFDAERTFGTVPAPMVTFPMGYALAIALVSLAGLSLLQAALLVSAASIVACMPLLWRAGERLGYSRPVCNVVAAAFTTNAAMIEFGGSAYSEALFTVLILGAIALLLRAREGGPRIALWCAAGLAFGVAYHVRYAGLFFVVGLAALAGWHFVRSRRALARGYVVAFACAMSVVAIGIVRNIALVGTWRGGNEKAVLNSIVTLVLQSAGAANRLVLGEYGAFDSTVIPRVALVLLVGAAAVLLFRWYRRGPDSSTPLPGGAGVADVAVLVAVYCACMFYAGVTTVISYSARMFVPVYPLLLLMAGGALARFAGPASPQLARYALLASLCIYAAVNLMVFRIPGPANPTYADALSTPNAAGRSAREAILGLAGDKGVVVASNGQILGYALGTRTLSLVGPKYSRTEWDAAALRAAVERFDAKVVAIYRPQPDEALDGDFVPSGFVRELSEGRAPAWLKMMYRDESVVVYAPQ